MAVAEVQINVTVGLGSLPCGHKRGEGNISKRDPVFVVVMLGVHALRRWDGRWHCHQCSAA